MEFALLGPLEVRDTAGLRPIEGQRQRALLALLLLNANQVVSDERLADAVWEPGEQPGQNARQAVVSRLRRTLAPRPGGEGCAIETRAPGYLLRVGRDDVDLLRVERLLDEGRTALAQGQAATAADVLREALGLWRGPSLDGFRGEAFAEGEVRRLDELRMAGIEERIDADLALGRHRAVALELEQLVTLEPLRERLRGQLMLALYRAGRQADALAAYEDARRALDDELGIQPTRALRELHRAILAQDAALELDASPAPAATPRAAGPVLVAALRDLSRASALLELAAVAGRALAADEVALVHVASPGDPQVASGAALTLLRGGREALEQGGLRVSAAAFSSPDAAADLAHLAASAGAALVLVDAAPDEIAGHASRAGLVATLARVPCDLAVLSAPVSDGPLLQPGPVTVPFGAGDHDWAALELGARLARALGERLLVAAAEGDDASRVVAYASLAMQRLVGIEAEPLLVPGGREGVLAAAERGSLLVVGLSDRWTQEGIGPLRAGIAAESAVPTLLVRASFDRQRPSRYGDVSPRPWSRSP
jgi:DNA-binding SARP family transcriptional activator